ncbi:MAG: ABC transporter substrate-binding protein [Acetobacteraceae bacterium]|nr:ABC transporter substrate-binding protein [Acetobacteraceae bacterium]MDW8397528.1 ABC transporter substrate-binding protein [Acetobacteraceae bacterium]
MTAPALGRRALAALVLPPLAARAEGDGWAGTLSRARGRTVAWHAWGGDERTNTFIAWVGQQVAARHGITLRHVRLRDTAEAVQRVLAEVSAGRREGGAVDMIWLNGPNFLALKQAGLLRRFADRLPNFALVDTVGKPATVTDFTVPVEGYAAPWRMARLVFIAEGRRVPDPPRDMPALLSWAGRNRGRFTHPHVRNFLGATFLKQALFELAPDRSVLARPADAAFDAAVAPLWSWYDALRPLLWRQGRVFPESGPAMRNLLNDGEIDIMLSFNPGEATASVTAGLLPASVRSFVPAIGSIGNASFVAIPLNASAPEAAEAVANFLLSPEAQARAEDPRHLGAPTVLDLSRLSPAERALFEAWPRGPEALAPDALGPALPEPHPSWMTRLTEAWERRVAA